MPNRRYVNGNHFERRVADALRGDGYRVWQTRGSKSPADLIALKIGQVLLVQVKSGVTGLDHTQWNALHELATPFGAVPIIADRDGRRIRYRRITDRHASRSQNWPTADWTPDAIAEPIT